MPRPKTQQYWLNKYYDLQESILLVYHPTEEDFWNDRTLYLADNYSPHKNYNHRGILDAEIVIEYDEKDKKLNHELALKVCRKLEADNIGYSLWWSGNKSYHVHTMINLREVTNPAALKRAFIRHYGEEEVNGKKVFPDLQLCSGNHLIRAENGTHEKTRKKKTLVKASKDYPFEYDVPAVVWSLYHQEMRKPRQAKGSKEIRAHPGFDYLLSTHDFQQAGDGHERALFIIIHALKDDYINKTDEFVKFMQDWYKYSGGKKLSPREVEHKVKYQLERTYVISARMIDELLEAIGKPELMTKNNPL